MVRLGMAYPLVLFVHSWLRWLVVGLAIVCSLRGAFALRSGRPFDKLDDKLGLAFIAALDTQILIGLLLYVFLSPMTQLAFADPGSAMRSSTLRFFLVEHAFSMSLALAAAHTFRVRQKRASESPDKHRRGLLGPGLALICLLVGIPWPFLPYPRPLARTSLETAPKAESNPELSEARSTYQTRCSPCHGAAGHGDGPAAPNLIPRPRDFHDPSWQKDATDEGIETILRRGGSAVGKSPMMPPNPDLDDAHIQDLRAVVREFGR